MLELLLLLLLLPMALILVGPEVACFELVDKDGDSMMPPLSLSVVLVSEERTSNGCAYCLRTPSMLATPTTTPRKMISAKATCLIVGRWRARSDGGGAADAAGWLGARGASWDDDDRCGKSAS